MRRTSGPPTPLALPTQAESEALAKKVLSKLTAKKASVMIRHDISAVAQYTRNEMRTVSGANSTLIAVDVDFDGRVGSGGTDRLDDAGLDEFIQKLETATKQKRDAEEQDPMPGPATFTDPKIFFQSSMDAGDAEWQGDLMRSLVMRAKDAGVIGAADLEVGVSARQVMNTAGFSGYSAQTTADLSMTARTTSGKGSGWCWEGGRDMAEIQPNRLADYAIDIAKRSDKPEAVEPGRYTVIMEPQAVEGLIAPIIGLPTSYMSAQAADMGFTVFSKKGGGNKIGLQMADRRVKFETDPQDPLVGFSPMENDGDIRKQQDWISQGILRDLWYPKTYARQQNRPYNWAPANPRLSVDMPTKTLQQMISETQRGIWIHRFSGIGVFNGRTLLLSGVTRDGAFLIENGKISKPIKNLRFSESPFFMLNKIDAVSAPIRTMGGGPPGRKGRFALPRIKAHDFEFIALSEAV